MQQINDRQQLKYVHMTLGTESYGMPARRASKIKIDSLTKPRFLRWYFKTNPEEGIGRIIHNPWNQHKKDLEFNTILHVAWVHITVPSMLDLGNLHKNASRRSESCSNRR